MRHGKNKHKAKIEFVKSILYWMWYPGIQNGFKGAFTKDQKYAFRTCDGRFLQLSYLGGGCFSLMPLVAKQFHPGIQTKDKKDALQRLASNF